MPRWKRGGVLGSDFPMRDLDLHVPSLLPVQVDKGCQLFGTVDEYKLLQPEQVFFQVSVGGGGWGGEWSRGVGELSNVCAFSIFTSI